MYANNATKLVSRPIFPSDLIISRVSIIGAGRNDTLPCLSILLRRQWGDNVGRGEA